MAFNSSIIAQLGQNQVQLQDPLDRYAKGLQLKQLMQGVQQQDAALAEDRAVREAYKASGGDFDRLKGLLQSGGNYRPLQALEKNRLETDKTRSDIDKDRIESTTKAIAQHRDALSMVNNPQDAAMWVESAYKDPYISPIFSRIGDVNTLVSRIPSDPAQFQQWKQQQALGATKFIEANKPQIVTSNLGATTQTQAVEPLTGGVRTLSQSANTVSPNTAATVAAQRDQASATRDAAKMTANTNIEMKLADDYRTQSKDFKDVSDAYAQINKTLDKATTSPAATLAAATKFMKLLDPGSVVRESELGMALAASGVLDRATNYYNTLAKGKVLTKAQAEDFKNITGQIYAAMQEQQNSIDADYRKKATEYGLRPEMIIQDLGQNKSQKSAAPQTEFNSLPDPAKYNGRRIQGPNGVMRSNGKSWVME